MTAMSEISALSPRRVWEIFDLVCSIPHPSGHEKALAEALKTFAGQHGLSWQQDDAGNLRIDRPAAPGFEERPVIIFQAHLDMVPEAEDPDFDFTVTPVSPYIDGDVVRARGTTLGGDDASGIALALALLTEPELKCGPLGALFTVGEEVGLLGASALAPEMLMGKYLINLDCGPVGEATIGCAGGARQEFCFQVEEQPAVGGIPLKITLSQLAGGHSGECIDGNRGNAVKSLAAFLLEHPELQLSEINGGNADNAIPCECSAVAVSADAAGVEQLKKNAAVFELLLRRELARDEISLTVEECRSMPEKIFTALSRDRVLQALSFAPNGVFENDDDLKIVKTSSNLAAVSTGDGKLLVRSSQRSLDDRCRENASAMLKEHFSAFGATAVVSNSYPGWTPRPDCDLVKCCAGVWKHLFGSELVFRAIHAGLECGLIGEKNPELELISLGPGSPGCHTVREYVLIAAMETMYRFLKELSTELK